MLRKCTLTLLLLLVSLMLAPPFGAGVALADEGDRSPGPVRLLATVPTPGVPLVRFDISWVDQDTQLYYLADRSNAVIDVVDAKRSTFVKQIPGGFKGFTGNNDTSGPNGVVTSGRWLFVTDAPSRVVSIDLKTDKIVDTVFTGGGADPATRLGFRADELAYDPQDGILLVVNNADTPPFATLIGANKQNGHLTLGRRITFTDATGGAEQPVWNPSTQRFYISIPELNGVASLGAVKKINPFSGAVEATFPVNFCSPAGLALGPRQDLLLGCSVVFDTDGKVWSPTDTKTTAPISVIMDAKNGSIDRNVPGVSGSDEVWFNPGDGRYYLAARNQPGGPVLGVIDAESQTLVQVVPTINAGGGTAHSVAANSHNNHVFVPLAANNVFPDCLNGCIAVFGTSPEGD